MDDLKIKQQVIAKIQEANKILVTVSKDPSVDELSAAIGLTMLLDKLGKYATSIFSGHTPPAIAFLEPEKTFDDTTDSLRDFIIALNKEKADHLRYKVEGDAVRIFITPYKTTITEEDLVFSQGDYNVELVIALGVDNHGDLDAALEEHGQILHDATVVTMTAGDQTSDLGGIDWHDGNSSSLSEMVAGLTEALKDDKKKPLLDNSIATALLTGIVAETDRFSNSRTSSSVMTVAANLMAAGADQQLIATELQAAEAAPAQDEPVKTKADDGALAVEKDDTTLSVEHGGETIADLEKRVGKEDESEHKEGELRQISSKAKEEAEKREAAALANSVPRSVYALPDDDVVETAPTSEPAPQKGEESKEETKQDAESASQRAYLGDNAAPAATPGSLGVNETPAVPAPGSAYALDAPVAEKAPTEPPVEPEVSKPEVTPPQQGSLSEQAVPAPAPDAPFLRAGEKIIQPLSDITPPAPSMPPAALPVSTPSTTTPPTPADLGLPLPPPLPDFSQGVAPPPAIPLPAAPAQPQPAILGDILTSEQPPAAPVQPAPVAPPLSAPIPQPVVSAPPVAPAVTPAPVNPGQFQIPGQPQ